MQPPAPDSPKHSAPKAEESDAASFQSVHSNESKTGSSGANSFVGKLSSTPCAFTGPTFFGGRRDSDPERAGEHAPDGSGEADGPDGRPVKRSSFKGFARPRCPSWKTPKRCSSTGCMSGQLSGFRFSSERSRASDELASQRDESDAASPDADSKPPRSMSRQSSMSSFRARGASFRAGGPFLPIAPGESPKQEGELSKRHSSKELTATLPAAPQREARRRRILPRRRH